MRTGLLEGSGGDEELWNLLKPFAATMRVFSEDASVVAGRYTLACGGNEVDGATMCKALKYCARTFFEQRQEELEERVQKELALMEEEEEEEEGEEEGEEEEEEEEEGEGEEEEGEKKEEEESYEVTDKDKRLVQHVNTIVETWSLWNPTDQFHIMIKNAIDNTPVE